MSLNVTLVVVGGDVKTPEVKLRLPSTVGRGRDCSIMLRHPLVSRQHCEIFESGGTLRVRDLGSLNGTFVNNQRIEGDVPLHPGQLLTIGTVTFRAMYEINSDATDANPPETPAPQLRSGKTNSNETDHDGTILARNNKSSDPTVRNASSDEATEPVDVGPDFDLEDAKPLFSEVTTPAAEERSRKNGAAGSPQPAHAPNNGKPAAPAKPAAAPPQPAAAPAQQAAPAPSFEFIEASDDEGGGEGDDDDLNDFLKNLK
jgi:predicted component of type VI protein secretion system